MRRKGTSEQLAKVRQFGLRLLEQGQTPKVVAEALAVTVRSVYRGRQAARRPRRKKRTRAPGRPRKLQAKQIWRLEKALDQGAYAFGYAGDYWTLDRIGQVIWQLFAVRYHPSAVWHVLNRMGWSSQQPQRRPLHRDDTAIEAWKSQVLPEIKKGA